MHMPPLSKLFPSTLLALSLLTGVGCSSDDEEVTGLIKFYNAESDSPDLFLTLDENLDEDNEDEFENTFPGVGFGEASNAVNVPVGDYFYEVAFQDDDSTQRDDLEILNEGSLAINEESVTFVVASGSTSNSVASIFNVELADTDELVSNDQFVLRVINAHPSVQAVDVYLSDTDETFNEAQLIATADSLSLTEAVTLDEDDYIVYLTEPGQSDVIFQSEDINYRFNTQYFLAIRENVGAGSNAFQLDNMTLTGLQSVSDVDSSATVRFYNGIHPHPSLPDYSGQIDLTVEDVSTDEVVITEQLSQNQISSVTVTAADDFSLNVVDSANGDSYVSNALFSVPENTARTVFFYVDEVFVDDDGDGNVDEDEDGVVDEIEAFVRNVVVNDVTFDGAVQTTVTVLNLADNDEFATVTVSFVESDETLTNADAVRSVAVGTSSNVSLLNNTYDVFAVATIDNQDIILDNFTLTLDENSEAQFLLFEHDDSASSGFNLNLVSQSSVD